VHGPLAGIVDELLEGAGGGSEHHGRALPQSSGRGGRLLSLVRAYWATAPPRARGAKITRAAGLMQTINEIVSAYNLSESEIQKIANEVKLSSIGCGTKRDTNESSYDTWVLLEDISDDVWYSAIEITHKILLGFQLYDIFPSYWHFLVPFYRGIRDKEISLPEHKEIIWKQFMQYLASESCYADPVGYVLWVEFFEDVTTVRETWQGLVNNCFTKRLLLTLLEFAGPVPFDLKEIYYKELVSDKASHGCILNSLLYSACDVYGQIDKNKARSI
nr:hypothetical protein [Tanacetum cinerariifolium]